ncbi:MAG TPA: hypothetical protein VJ764_00730 [Steroidobacteraceae bacterium]|nr:hypothetical protein [Steroidobacteraceae bacterium]
MAGQLNFDHLVKDPWEHFVAPMDVVSDKRFTKDEKKKILESWALDAELLSKAESENMTGQPGDLPRLQAVKLALLELDKQ